MGNPENAHTAARTVRTSLDRPQAHRPASRRDGSRPTARPIEEVLVDLAGARQRYEDLRVDSGPLAERARLMSLLQELRAEASNARHSLGRS